MSFQSVIETLRTQQDSIDHAPIEGRVIGNLALTRQGTSLFQAGAPQLAEELLELLPETDQALTRLTVSPQRQRQGLVVSLSHFARVKDERVDPNWQTLGYVEENQSVNPDVEREPHTSYRVVLVLATGRSLIQGTSILQVQAWQEAEGDPWTLHLVLA